jgi:hypothetical protein
VFRCIAHEDFPVPVRIDQKVGVTACRQDILQKREDERLCLMRSLKENTIVLADTYAVVGE